MIRTRIRGASEATGEVLVFLDSHCEVTNGWLEPLLDPIARNPNVTTVPIIDTIHHTTFEFIYHPDGNLVGGFDWQLMFDWTEARPQKRVGDPIKSPTMAGEKLIAKIYLMLDSYRNLY